MGMGPLPATSLRPSCSSRAVNSEGALGSGAGAGRTSAAPSRCGSGVHCLMGAGPSAEGHAPGVSGRLRLVLAPAWGPRSPMPVLRSRGPRLHCLPGAGRPAGFRGPSRRLCPRCKRRDPRDWNAKVDAGHPIDQSYKFDQGLEKGVGLIDNETKLKKKPMPFLVIDHVEMPTPNSSVAAGAQVEVAGEEGAEVGALLFERPELQLAGHGLAHGLRADHQAG